MDYNILLVTITTLIFVTSVKSQDKQFEDYFSSCKIHSSGFNDCIKDALNDVRPFFKSGVPTLGIAPFDPFFAKEVVQKRGGQEMNYLLKLRNVKEHGWTQSLVTKFKADLSKNRIVYTQFFPEKYLDGEYIFEGHLLNSSMKNKGVWNITLYDYIQTTTITWPSGSRKLKVLIEVQKIGNLSLHISNLLRGRSLLESILDQVINRMWQPGFVFIRPLINDLVSTAFTEIFRNAFQSLDFQRLFPD